ncbi:ABC transporter permease [Halomonas sp. KAO]|uniref:ABC transporter permease n=1 Tax=Halomonas sp. KAO TaxID=2783858 RepID=UPI00189DF723|nr:ABC transporter permease [Halomonas sp. KAO]MBF7051905.1 ABC transporter permease [Halomonas sp. KAO]
MELAEKSDQNPTLRLGRELSLRKGYKKSERLKKIKAFALVFPLLMFSVSMFVFPIVVMFKNSIVDSELVQAWHNTPEVIQNWPGHDLPSDDIFFAVANDIVISSSERGLAAVARRLNYEKSGMRSLLSRTGRKVKKDSFTTPSEAKALLLNVDSRWGEVSTWQAIKRASSIMTSKYLLQSLDLKINNEGSLAKVDESSAIYFGILIKTLFISFVVTLTCLALGFPLAHLIANSSEKTSRIMLIFVLLPLWTSLLVKTSAWMVLLQKNGLANNLLQGLGVISEPLSILYARPAVYIAMTHLLLPFMILSLYSVMKNIPPSYFRAAISLGATPVKAFLKVYIPLALPGIVAGCLLCFVISLGYYITPALVGGAGDQMLSYFIAYYTNTSMNWGLASALGVVLFVISLILFYLYINLSSSKEERVKS